MSQGIVRRVRDEIGYLTQPNWSLADVAQHYDGLAEQYDAVNEAAHSHFRRFTDALRLTDLPAGGHVLEIFSRTGEGTVFFRQQGKAASAVCVDVSPKMGEICRRRLREAGFDETQWIHMTEYSLPFEDGEFDVILFLETIEHVSEPDRLVEELARVIKAGGTMVLSTPNVLWEPIHALAAVTGLHHSEGPHRFIRYHRIVEMVEQTGFRVEYAETNVLIPAGPRWLVEIGQWLEERLRHSVMPWIGLRRMLICRKT